MPRPRMKKKVEKTKFKFKATSRFQKPDPRFGNLILAKLINQIMYDGKKTTAQRIVYESLDILSQRVKGKDPVDVFLQAVENVKPRLEVRSKRVGGATYQVPMEVSGKRQQTLALRQIVSNCRGKKGRPMARRLADELLDAFNNQGSSVTWRENTHKMAEANKLFAHFAW